LACRPVGSDARRLRDEFERYATLTRRTRDKVAVGCEIEVSLAIGRDTLASDQPFRQDSMGTAQFHSLKSVLYAPRQPGICTNPERAVGGFVERFDSDPGQSFGGGVCGEVIAVITVQTVLRASPQ